MKAGVEALRMNLPALSSPFSASSRVVTAKGLAIAALHMSYVVAAMFGMLWAFLHLRWGVQEGVVGFDFEGTLWDSAVAIREGRSPYPAAVRSEIEVGNPAVYPPLLMLVVAPLTVLPWSVGLALWSAVLVGAVAGTLYILDVRDARCYLLALISLPVVVGGVFGNATLLLVPMVALAWRWRGHWRRVGILVGLAIASKLFLWPLLFWLLGTRRYRAFGAAVVATAAFVMGPWALIGFDGASAYPDLLRMAEEVYAVHSYSVATMLSALGTDTELASRVALALGVLIAAAAFYAGRRRADSTSASLAMLAAILGSPIVWPYYYVLLLVPLAIARPRFSGLWICLMLFFVPDRLPREWLESSDLAVGGIGCCRPVDVPVAVWMTNHSPPGLWPAVGFAVLTVTLVVACVATTNRARTAA